MSLLITIENLNIIRDKKTLIHNLNLHIQTGQRWAVTGPSGIGKSTLLMMLAGLLKIKQGRITIGNQIVDKPNPAVAMMLQRPALLPWANIRDNIALGLKFNHQIKNNDAKDNIDRLLEKIGLQDRQKSYPHELSGGQQQRVALARSLALKPRVLLLDEPFSALDKDMRAQLRQDVLDMINDDHITLLLVTHHQEDVDALCHQQLDLSSQKYQSKEITQEFYHEELVTA